VGEGYWDVQQGGAGEGFAGEILAAVTPHPAEFVESFVVPSPTRGEGADMSAELVVTQ
jgi:hypothetical protein